MKILTIIRKSGKTIIEMPDDANVLDVLKENEIQNFESATFNKSVLPDEFRIYECTDCQEINVKKDNKQIRVGFCDHCDHPLWNSIEDTP